MTRWRDLSQEDLDRLRALGTVRTHRMADEAPNRPAPRKQEVRAKKPPSPLELAVMRLTDYGVPAPEYEFKFHQRRRWRFDAAWPSLMLAVEIDGAVYAQGRHTRGKGYEADCEKLNAAALAGWCVLRYSTGMCKRGDMVRDVLSYVDGPARLSAALNAI